MPPKTISSTIFFIAYIVPVTQGAWFVPNVSVSAALEADIPAYESALKGGLINAAKYKTVNLDIGQDCDPAESSCIAGVTQSTLDAPLPDSLPCSEQIQCSPSCLSELDISSLRSVTPVDSLGQLTTGQNAAIGQDNMSLVSYLLALRATDLTNETGEVTLLTIQIQTSFASQFTPNILVKLNRQSADSDLVVVVLLDGDSSGPQISIKDTSSLQIAILSSADDREMGVLVNSVRVFRRTDATVTSLTLSSPTQMYQYEVTDWDIYNTLLTSQELYTMRYGSSPDVVPNPTCNCPPQFPLFQRQPAQGDVWYGTVCESLGQKDRFVLRLSNSSYSPSFITDDDMSTKWVSFPSGGKLSKFTVDLSTNYQIFLAVLSLNTMPKYIVVTSALQNGDTERVLMVVAPNCDDPLPSELPQGERMRCQEQEYANLYSNYSTYAQLLLHWGKAYMFHGDSEATPAIFFEALSNNLFLSRYVSFYLYDFEVGATHHVINDLEILATCGCATPDECSLRKNTRTKRAPAIIPRPPSVTYEPVITEYSFEEITGFQCECSLERSTTGLLCDECAPGLIFSNGTCESCGCNLDGGAVNNICTADGICTCSLTGINAEKSKLVDDKCNPFIYSIHPSYGPIAGGTEVQLYGGWLQNVDKIILGEKDCVIAANRRNETWAVCKTPPVDEPQDVSLSIISEPLPEVSFEYRPNPSISSVDRAEVFIEGGLPIPVRGSNLDSTADPMIFVSVKCRSSGTVLAVLNETCQVKTPELMECKSPDFTSKLRDARCAVNVQSRQKRQAKEESEFVFYVGFGFDGHDKFVNISAIPELAQYGRMYVRPNPSIEQFHEGDKIRRLLDADELVEIEGSNLQSGTTKEDYKVEVGVGECTVTSLSDNVIVCKLPVELPEPSSDHYGTDRNGETDEKLPAVTVLVGNLEQHVGYILFQKQDNTIVVVVVVVVVVIVIVAVIIVIFVFKRKKRNTKFKKEGLPEKNLSRYVAGPHGRVILLQENHMDSEHMQTLKPWMIPLDHLTISTPLGQGQFGKVFLGSLLMRSGTQRQVAVKTLKAELLSTDSQAITNFLQEAVIMKDFNHPNILSLIGVVLNEQQLPMVVIPYMARGDMKKVLKDDTMEFTVGDLLHLALQVSNGMDYLAKRKFIHRDLAARNCMIDEQFYVKVADFGLSHNIYSEDYYRVQDKAKPLPVKWMAIESLIGGKYTTESDVWSYGVLLWEILTRGATPYPGINNYDVKERLKMGERLSQPEYCPSELYDLMCACWHMEPLERPHFFEISETLNTFQKQGCDYDRLQTKEIEDDYYLIPISNHDKPIYQIECEEAGEDSDIKLNIDGDYDTAEVVLNPSPANDSLDDDKYCTPELVELNTNNSNSSRYTRVPTKGSPPKLQLDEDGYMKPDIHTPKTAPNQNNSSHYLDVY